MLLECIDFNWIHKHISFVFIFLLHLWMEGLNHKRNRAMFVAADPVVIWDWTYYVFPSSLLSHLHFCFGLRKAFSIMLSRRQLYSKQSSRKLWKIHVIPPLFCYPRIFLLYNMQKKVMTWTRKGQDKESKVRGESEMNS